MQCLTPEQVELLARDEFASATAGEIRLHLDECEACRRKLDEYLANDDLLRGLRQSPLDTLVSPLDPHPTRTTPDPAPPDGIGFGRPPGDSFPGYP